MCIVNLNYHVLYFSLRKVSGSRLICAGVQRPHYGGLVDVLTSITRTDGVHGLYRGVTLGILTAGCTWGSYFFL